MPAVKKIRVESFDPLVNTSNVNGVVAVAQGGTGSTTASDAINALMPSQTSNSGKFLTTNGLVVSWATVSGGGGGSGPTISTVNITDSGYNVLDDTAIGLNGGYIRINGTNFVTGASVVVGQTVASSVSFVSSTQLNCQIPALAAGTYIVYVINPDGGVALGVNGLTASATPSWVTGSTLPGQSVDSNFSITLIADLAVSYVLQAGSSLPPGVTLTSGGVLSGNVTGLNDDTLYSFTIVAIDAESQDSPRTFSITIATLDPYFKNVSLLLRSDAGALSFAEDASTNNFNIVINGDTKGSNFSPYLTGWSNYFDGTGDYLTVPASSQWIFASDHTIEAWVYPTGTTTDSHIIGTGGSTSDDQFGFRPGNGTGYVLYAYAANGNQYLTQTANIPLNTWSHIAVSRTVTTLKAFVNGVEVASKNISVSIGQNAINYIGSRTGTINNMTGYISNIRVINGVGLYTANFAPPISPLTAVANTSLLTCQSNRLIDKSSNNFTVTKNGDVTVVTTNPFGLTNTGITGSAYFDGTGDYLSLPSNSAFAFGTGDFTVEGWVYYTSVTNSGIFQISATLFALQTGIGLGLDTSLRWMLYYGNGSAANAGAIGPTANTWHHFAVVRSSSTTKLYINGTATSISVADSFNYTGQVLGIAGIYSTAYLTNGYISNFRVVKGTAVYTANFTPPASSLTAIANTSLLTLQYSQAPNNNTFLDSSDNNFNLIRNGNTTSSTFTPFYNNYSVYFDGTGDYLTIPANSAFQFTGDYTVELWVYFNSLAGTQDLVGNYVSSTSADWVILMSSTTLQYYPSSAASYVISYVISANTWYHVAAVRNGNTCSLYVNGVSVGTPLSFSGTLGDGTRSIYIGTRTATGNYINGYISNLRIVKGTALYTSNFTPPTEALTAIANTSLLTCLTYRWQDISTNNFTITNSGDAKIVKFSPITLSSNYSPANFGASAYFDGTGDFLAIAKQPVLRMAGNFTVEAWIYITSYAANRTICGLGVNNSSGFSALSWRINITTGLLVSYWSTTGSSETAISGGTIPLYAWTHVAACRLGSNIVQYVNGIVTAAGTVSGDLYAGSAADGALGSYAIGAYYSSGSASTVFLGNMSNFRYVKGSDLYLQPITVPTSQLTAISGTSLLTCQSATIVDNSINGFTITVVGNAQVSADDPFSSASAYSVIFDGNGDYITVPDNEVFNFGTGNFTVECWVKLNVIQNSFIFNQWETSTGSDANSCFLLQLTSGSKFSVSVAYGASTSQVQIIGTSTPVINTWYHIAAVRNGVALTLFVNGVPEGVSTTLGASATNNSNLVVVIGARRDATLPLNGYVSNARIVKGTAVYTTNFTPSTTPVLSATGQTELLMTGSAAGVYDMTGNNSIETVANARSSTVQTQYLSASTYFDGTGDYLSIPGSGVFSIASTTTPFTIEAWVYPTAAGGCIFSEQFTAGGNVISISVPLCDGTTISNTNGLFVALGWYNGSVWTAAAIASTALSTNTWTYVTTVFTGSTTKIFYNGVDVTKSSSPTPATTWNMAGYIGDNWYVGKRWDTTATEFFTGYISDFRFTNGIARYTSNFSLPSGPNRTR